MSAKPGEIAVIGAGIAYLLALGWAIGNVSYDVWGALVVIPVYALIGLAVVGRMFRGALQPLAVAMSWGLLIKLGGTFARYWVGFEAYGGGLDAARYHRVGAEAAAKVWSGEEGIVTVLPRGTGTPFIEHFTAFVYTLTGSSQLAGFITFSFLAYLGTIFMVKAAAIAVPRLAARRYAWMCVIFPSIVYWPASIGKEATILLGLGIATYGIATMFSYGRWIRPILLIAAGLGFTSLIRPHVAGIWIAAVIPGLVVALVGRKRVVTARGQKKNSTLGIVLVLAIAAIGLSVMASATVRYLTPGSEEVSSTNVTQILEETTRRTSEAGSNFTPPSVSSPTDWPLASIRTLTRPLPQEARGIAQLISAAEIAALFAIYAISWRRLLNLPRLLITHPYVAFVVTAIFLTGLAYSSFANLGVLTRQKSLIFPFLVLLPCLPERESGTPPESEGPYAGRTLPIVEPVEMHTEPALTIDRTKVEGRMGLRTPRTIDDLWD